MVNPAVRPQSPAVRGFPGFRHRRRFLRFRFFSAVVELRGATVPRRSSVFHRRYEAGVFFGVNLASLYQRKGPWENAIRAVLNFLITRWFSPGYSPQDRVRRSLPCWGITTQASPCGPTPTPPGRSRTRQRRPWATSWHRCGNTPSPKQHSAPVGKSNFPAGALHFLRGVGHGVGQIFLLSESYNFLHSKTPRKRLFSGRFVELVG